MLGQALVSKALSSKDESIDVSSLASGVYTIYFNAAKVSHKFVKN
jgi:hypothetical protein